MTMPERTFDRDWVYKGTIYRAGETADVPEEFAARIDQVLGREIDAASPSAPPPVAAPRARAIPDEMLESLRAAGLTDDDAIRGASDDRLMRVKGVGRSGLRQIREVYGESEG